MNTGDTAFVLVSSALVMLMTPGLALFYGGMVRGRTCWHDHAELHHPRPHHPGMVLWGYSLSFRSGPRRHHRRLGLVRSPGVGMEPHETYGPTVPHLAFIDFSVHVRRYHPALITGAFAERMRFISFLLFTLLWQPLFIIPCSLGLGFGRMDVQVRSPGLCWRHGGAHQLRSLCPCGCAGRGEEARLWSTAYIPHNLPMTITGAALLWFGWFGFNAGSALAANGLAASAFVVTHIASAWPPCPGFSWNGFTGGSLPPWAQPAAP